MGTTTIKHEKNNVGTAVLHIRRRTVPPLTVLYEARVQNNNFFHSMRTFFFV